MTTNTPVGQCRQFMRACNLLIEFWVRKMKQRLIYAIYYTCNMCHGCLFVNVKQRNTEQSKMLN